MKNIDELKILCWVKHARHPKKCILYNSICWNLEKKKILYWQKADEWFLWPQRRTAWNTGVMGMFLSGLWWSHRCKPSFPLHSSHFHGLSWPANSGLLPHILHILLVSFPYTLTTICHIMFYFLLCILYILLVQCLAHKISYINICQINK